MKTQGNLRQSQSLIPLLPFACVGAGAEILLGSHWVARVQYRFSDFGYPSGHGGAFTFTDVRVCSGCPSPASSPLTVSYEFVVRAGAPPFPNAPQLYRYTRRSTVLPRCAAHQDVMLSRTNHKSAVPRG